jgi:hypothetical protein
VDLRGLPIGDERTFSGPNANRERELTSAADAGIDNAMPNAIDSIGTFIGTCSFLEG